MLVIIVHTRWDIIMITKIKIRVHQILEKSDGKDFASTLCDAFLLSLILLNICAVILETIASAWARWEPYFHLFEYFSVAIFTVEYVLRLWSCTAQPGYENPLSGRMRYMKSPIALMDIFAILPFYLPMLFSIDMRFIRILRLMRLFRLFKLGRYTRSLQLLVKVIQSKKPDLVISLVLLGMLLVLSSSLIYFFEKEAQPQIFSSIPASMWWGIVTLTTIGYGDMVPVTIAGKLLGSLICVLGMGIFALPAAILASGLLEEIHNSNRPSGENDSWCPHCGKKYKSRRKRTS